MIVRLSVLMNTQPSGTQLLDSESCDKNPMASNVTTNGSTSQFDRTCRNCSVLDNLPMRRAHVLEHVAVTLGGIRQTMCSIECSVEI